MKATSLSSLQKELKTFAPADVLDICMRLAKHKKENKELLHYLLFEAQDEKAFIQTISAEMDELFRAINRSSAYTTKKGLQKIVRLINKYIKYSGIPQTEIELRMYFCNKFRAARISLNSSQVISNLYYREVEKIKKAFAKLHEDLQFDYREEIEKLG